MKAISIRLDDSALAAIEAAKAYWKDKGIDLSINGAIKAALTEYAASLKVGAK